jgi:hypothetical protein
VEMLCQCMYNCRSKNDCTSLSSNYLILMSVCILVCPYSIGKTDLERWSAELVTPDRRSLVPESLRNTAARILLVVVEYRSYLTCNILLYCMLFLCTDVNI